MRSSECTERNEEYNLGLKGVNDTITDCTTQAEL